MHGNRLMTNDAICAEIERGTCARLKAMGATTERIILELVRIAFHDKRSIYNKDGSIKPPSEWDDATAAALSGMDVEELYEGRGEDRHFIGNLRKVRFAEKTKALELLGKYRKLWTDKVEFPGKDGEPQQIGGLFTDLELASRLYSIMEKAAKKRIEEEAKTIDVGENRVIGDKTNQ
jgi:phage terminase small subunit